MLGLDIASKRKRKITDYPYRQEYELRWSDNDMFGHMNNPNYGVLCDSIANTYLIRACGYAPPHSAQAAIIANTYFDYFGSVAYPSTVEVGLRVAKIGKSSVLYEVGVFAKGDEDVKAVGGSMHVWVENLGGGKLGRPTKEGMPRHVRQGYLELMEPEARRAVEGDASATRDGEKAKL